MVSKKSPSNFKIRLFSKNYFYNIISQKGSPQTSVTKLRGYTYVIVWKNAPLIESKLHFFYRIATCSFQTFGYLSSLNDYYCVLPNGFLWWRCSSSLKLRCHMLFAFSFTLCCILKYRLPSLFAVLLFAVSTIRGPENRGKPWITREKHSFSLI